MSDSYVLVLFYSRTGAVERLAREVALGVEKNAIEARLRTVPPVTVGFDDDAPSVPDTGAPFCIKDELAGCAGLAMGSPTRFGNMAAPLKHFIDQSSDLWMQGALVDKPAAVFTASSSQHGGQESTLLSMMLPLFHHGMLMAGIPYTNDRLMTTHNGGTPYGASHVAGMDNVSKLDDDEALLARALGERLGKLAKQLESM